MTWGWANNDRILVFVWTIPLKKTVFWETSGYILGLFAEVAGNITFSPNCKTLMPSQFIKMLSMHYLRQWYRINICSWSRWCKKTELAFIDVDPSEDLFCESHLQTCKPKTLNNLAICSHSAFVLGSITVPIWNINVALIVHFAKALCCVCVRVCVCKCVSLFVIIVLMMSL